MSAGMQPPKFAVLLAAYNGIQFIPEQVSSILEQRDVNVTLFVSVDRSADGTELWFDNMARRDRRIILLPHGEQFGGAARNFSRLIRDVDFSNFEYACFADQDDIWLPDKLSRAHEILMHAGADAYSSNVIAFWPTGRKVLIRKSQPQVRWDYLFEAAGPGCTYVLKTQLASAIQDLLKARWIEVQQVGLHDWLSYAFARANGYRWVIDDYAGMLYRQHEGNQIGVNSGWSAFIYRARRVLSGWGLTQSALIARLVGLETDPFVMLWSYGRRVGFLQLAMHAGQCRRRIRDKWLFAFSCLILCVIGGGKR